MEFEFDGRRPENDNLLPISVRKMFKICDSLPDGKLVSFVQLTSLTGYTLQHLQSFGRMLDGSNSFLAKDPETGLKKRWFGNKNTVEAWKKQQSNS